MERRVGKREGEERTEEKERVRKEETQRRLDEGRWNKEETE